jgi:hypothetical protein
MYPWIIEASLNYTSLDYAELILQTEALVVNGIATFTKLGISDIVDNFIISYKIKTPEGIDSYGILISFFFSFKFNKNNFSHYY